MAQSAIELLRSYANLIEAAEDFQAPAPPPPPEDGTEDSSVDGMNDEPMDDDNDEGSMNDFGSNDMEPEVSDDPVHDMSSAIADVVSGDAEEIYATIEAYLKKNQYEITPLHGLINKQGNF